jgi:hypothetical protein
MLIKSKSKFLIKGLGFVVGPHKKTPLVEAGFLYGLIFFD